VTYSDGREYILELVDQCNEPRVVYVDAVVMSVLLAARGCPRHYVPTHLGLPPWLAMCGVCFSGVSGRRVERNVCLQVSGRCV
jgi:hypothetical protein